MRTQNASTSQIIPVVAEELKKIGEIKAPQWANFVKTGVHKERPPMQRDWWHIRAAAVLLSVGKLGPVGVSKLRTKYGGRKNNGYSPEHFYRGSGSIARKILQQLEGAGLVEKGKKGIHKGRIITKKGVELVKAAEKKVAPQPHSQ
ncbi:30S ribosomal protein S19e [Candidatus Woesearchaeota archaeon CG07_land_8_20_14_0_80_44_23]|nr:MAG: 30S ribosomal protein S19e [Candidatus Woesearchaeota archaeon CG07_land_8_20_14_0_80_44_23]